MLYAKRNQAYVDDEEQAKKITFERTLKWVNRLYPDDNKEVSLKPNRIANQLQYGYDSLFEVFRSAIEQVLSANYNDELTTQKSYEIIRKYNQLSSYLKNIIKLNQLPPEDEEKIKKDFDDLGPKLEALKKVAIENNFSDKQDIIDMVESINQTTSTKKSEYNSVSAKSVSMVNMIKSKAEAELTLGKVGTLLAEIETLLDQSSGKTLTKSSYDSFTQSTNNLNQEYENIANKNISESDYKSISDNYRKTEQLLTEIKTYKLAYKTDFVKKINKTITEMNSVLTNEHDPDEIIQNVFGKIEKLSDKELSKNATTQIKNDFAKKAGDYSDNIVKIKDDVVKLFEDLKSQISLKEIDMDTFRDEVVVLENTLQQKIDTWNETIYDEYKQKIEKEKGSAVAEHKDDVEKKKEPKKHDAKKKPKEIKPTSVIYTNKLDFHKAFNEAVLNNIKSKETSKPSIYTKFKSATNYSMSALGGTWDKYAKLTDAEKQEYFKKK